MPLRTTLLPPSGAEEQETLPNGESNGHVAPNGLSAASNGHSAADAPIEGLRTDAIKQHNREERLKIEDEQIAAHHGPTPLSYKIFHAIEFIKTRKTARILFQIWQSDYSIIAFVLVVLSFYVMKDTRYPPIGLLFFIIAMATVDAILSIFVVRLSFHQNKHGFYRTEDFERDWLRYRILLLMTKATLLFVVLTSCGTPAFIASYVVWFFTSTQRLRYVILRWSMDEHYPELQRWSIFTVLREFGVEPRRRNFDLVAAIGIVIGFLIVFAFP